MKKIVFLFVIISAVFSGIFAQSSMLLKVGGVYTMDFEKVGFLTGLEYGHNIDEMVNVNLGVEFQKTGEKKKTRDDSVRINGSTSYRTIETSDMHYNFPVKAGLRIRMPVGAAVLPVISGGVGYTFYNHNSNTRDTTDKLLTLDTDGLHTGFFWEGGLGFDWKLGGKSSLIGDLVYQSSEPKNEHDYSKNLSAVKFYAGLLVEF